MAMIPAKCTQCGANISVDDTKEAGICENCGTAFITEKAIINYNTVNNYHADVVNIYSAQSEGFEIKAGVLIKYNGSKDIVTVPDEVKIIGKSAFANLEGLVSVTLPNSVQEIEGYAFSKCKSLKIVSLPSSIKKIPSHCFYACESLTMIDVPFGCLEIDSSAFSSCTKLTHISLPNSLQIIQDDAFHACRSLESIVIPESVKQIQGYGNKYSEITKQFHSANSCFSECTSLKTVTFEGSKIEILCSPYRGLFDIGSYQISIVAEDSWKNQNEKKLISVKTSSGCYIATCVYGSYDCPQVWTLRRYRDNTLVSTWHGRIFIRTYYAISPTVVKWFGNTQWFKKIWKNKLDKMVSNLRSNGVEDTPYQDKDWR